MGRDGAGLTAGLTAQPLYPSPCLTIPARRDRLGQNAHQLKHDRHADPGRAAGRIEGRRDLNKIGPYQIDSGQFAHNLLRKLQLPFLREDKNLLL